MHFIQGGKKLHKEGGGVFPCVDHVGKYQLGVTVTAQALGEAEPRRQTGDNGSDPVDILGADRFPCKCEHTSHRARGNSIVSTVCLAMDPGENSSNRWTQQQHCSTKN